MTTTTKTTSIAAEETARVRAANNSDTGYNGTYADSKHTARAFNKPTTIVDGTTTYMLFADGSAAKFDDTICKATVIRSKATIASIFNA